MTSAIELAPDVPAAALRGLGSFSHVEVVFHFHTLSDDEVVTDARHPRSNPDWPEVGILAQRGSKRPNRLGVSACELLDVAERTLHVRGLDAIDGTPVLDVKPVMREFLPRGEIRQPRWAGELMAGYWTGSRIDDDPR